MEEDILDVIKDAQFKKINKMSWIKFVVSVVTAIGGFGGGWYKMEYRVSELEKQMEQQEKIKLIEQEIHNIKRDEELAELKLRITIDSIKTSYREKNDIR
jgi:hypothetical protein|tara:strand:- start:158 stop:457 length:300 start_codon:yes stop_codon:yes gene_type:complete